MTAPAPLDDDLDEEPAPRVRPLVESEYVPESFTTPLGTLYPTETPMRVSPSRQKSYVPPDPACPECEGSGWGPKQPLTIAGHKAIRQRPCSRCTGRVAA
jgi:hypothetical protein